MNALKTIMSDKTARTILVSAVMLEALYLFYLQFNLAGKNIPAYMIFYAIAFCIYFFAIKVLPKTKPDEGKSLLKNKTLLVIIAAGVIFRITLMPSHITTSDDVYRYIWEGKVLYNGYNPYQHPPGDTALIPLHSQELPAKVTFHTFAAIYPPLSQVLFVVNYVISGENELGLKLIFLLAEIVTMIFIIKILKERKCNLNNVLYYAWLPLPIMEYFVNAHVDPVGIMFFVMFIYFTLKNNMPVSAVMFALSFLSKLYPVFLLPLLIKRYGFKKSIIFGLIFCTIVIAAFLPFVPKDRFVAESLLKYLANWQFNSSFYYIFLNILHNGYQAKIICNIMLVLTVFSVSFFYKDFLRAVYVVLIAVIAFTATIYPWYMGWIAAIHPAFGFFSVFSFFFTINLSNLTPLSVGWKEYWWVLLIEYIPLYSLLIYDLGKMLKNRKRIN
jgi:hypothetical protein